MARSFSNVKTISTLLAENFSLASSRRSFAAAAASQGISSSSRSDIVRMTRQPGVTKEETGLGEESSAWIPDPATGYYRPANRPQEIDVAELREALFKQRAGNQ